MRKHLQKPVWRMTWRGGSISTIHVTGKKYTEPETNMQSPEINTHQQIILVFEIEQHKAKFLARILKILSLSSHEKL